jgi:hypothetical protein
MPLAEMILALEEMQVLAGARKNAAMLEVGDLALGSLRLSRHQTPGWRRLGSASKWAVGATAVPGGSTQDRLRIR